VKNKDHWYDGLFYDLVIAPNQDTSYELVEQLIMPGAAVLDAGCGTGRFALKMKRKYSIIDGVDLSLRNINVAEKKKIKLELENVNFYHDDVINFLNRTKNSYDYAVLSYMIHEINPDLRNEILKKVSDSADEVILIDYLVPRNNGIWSVLNEVIEFAAGKDHYRNFKTYVDEGGIAGLAASNGLKIIREIKDVPSTSHIAVLKKVKS
jgi:SAM-dependent methyltransferase